MAKLVIALASSTALFAASTAYLAFQLHERNAVEVAGTTAASSQVALHNSDTVGGLSSAVASKSVASASSPISAPVAATSVGPNASVVAPGAGKKDPNREMMTPFAKDYLRQYDDMALRASLIANARPGIESQYSRLKDRLKLDSATFDQLVDLIAEETLEQQANYYRCVVDTSCDLSRMKPPRDRSDELQALLGDDYSKFKSYREALPEWQSVVQLRGRLPESLPLRDSDAERLMNALSEERGRFTTESSQNGASTRGWGNGTGMLWYAGDGGADQQLASARQYSDRMRQRAASVLSAEQLRFFVQMQEEMLAQLASFLATQAGSPG
jgi:hypothetical protein